VYGHPTGPDEYEPLYEQCRALEGVNYRGSVSQTELAKELAGATMLTYPNTFAETGCIVAMEALAAGLLVVTSDLGALPETCGKWAHLVPGVGPTRTAEQFAIDFARTVIQSLMDFQANRAAFFAQRYEQSLAINASCTWAIRAEQWEKAAEDWLKS
jgi:glycosyltransferase involved in cell wall biosynthesis